MRNYFPSKSDVDYSIIYEFDNSPANLARFQSPNGQREIKPQHVKDIYDAIRTSGSYFAPIQVSIDGYFCFDGNYRLEAYKRLADEGVNVVFKVIFYNMTKERAEAEVIKTNSNSKSWTGNDYIKARVEKNDINMLRLINFAETKRTDGDVIMFNNKGKINNRYLYAIVFGKDITSVVKDPDAELPPVTERVLEKANKTYNRVNVILKTLNNSGLKSNNWVEGMIKGWFAFQNETNIDDAGVYQLINKLNPKLAQCGNSPKQWHNFFKETLEG